MYVYCGRPPSNLVCPTCQIVSSVRPGSDNWLLNAMAHVIIADGLENKEFIKTRTESYEELKRIFEGYHT